MAAPLDLYRASREELVVLVVRQRARIADLEREQARLQAELAAQQAAVAQLQERVGALLALLETPDGEGNPTRPTTMPELKPAGRGGVSAPERRARKRRVRGSGRRRMRPTARQVHAFARYPRCATALAGGTIRHTREIIEVAPVPVVVTEHVYVERRCPRFQGRWQPARRLTGWSSARGGWRWGC
ncbi:MAG: hypothetical protein K0S78_1614 [Thermomicrobiales bacterium]|nr:hypothetical protein [Thermomicrobiales bacterium]